MKINVQTPNFTAKDELLDFVQRKLSKLEQFYDKIIFADVFMKLLQTSDKENKAVEILLSIPGGDIMIKKEAKSFEEALDDNIRALERQLKKRKQKEKVYL